VPIQAPDSAPSPVAEGVAVGVTTGVGVGVAVGVGEAEALGVGEAVVFGMALQALRPPRRTIGRTIAAAVPERAFLTAVPSIEGLLLEIIGGGSHCDGSPPNRRGQVG
jgi:hypothetical protein